MARKYELKRRAESQEETRRRILDATVELHQTVGGEQASISAIAKKAGVERLTVYRHFPDERALIEGCTSHYLAQNPPPDPGPWATIADPEARLRTGLTAVYAYHRQTEVMSNAAVRDIPKMPVLREVLAPAFAYWDGVRDMLAAGWSHEDKPCLLTRAAVGHAISFVTWRSLVREQGLDDVQAVELMVGMIRCTKSAWLE
jgi:AcrR family transcriptional regulator